MQPTIDDATAQFLAVAVQDLQQQVGFAADVEHITVAEAATGLWLTARIVVGTRTVEVSSYGDSLITAYSDLRSRVAEARLIATYRELVEA